MPPTYTLAELESLTGLPSRTIRGYIAQGLIERPPAAGPATTHTRETLGRLAFLRHVRREKGGILYGVAKKQLAELGDDGIEAWASQLDPLETEGQEKAATPASDASTRATRASSSPAPAPTPPRATAERWLKVVLVSGLELMMREGSDERVAKLAAEIQAKYRETS